MDQTLADLWNLEVERDELNLTQERQLSEGLALTGSDGESIKHLLLQVIYHRLLTQFVLLTIDYLTPPCSGLHCARPRQESRVHAANDDLPYSASDRCH